MKVIILAGGRGTRLWPVSRHSFPKQFLHFGDQKSLLQKTIERYQTRYAKEDIIILTHQEYLHLVKSQCQEIDPTFSYQILVEPESKNTAPAIMVAIKYLQEHKGVSEEETILVSSSDHLITPEDRFLDAMEIAAEECKDGSLITFGIRPNAPECGYGYIKGKQGEDRKTWKVEKFVEKPSYSLAQQYVMSGDYLWNSGIFVFSIKTFWKELELYCPDLFRYSQDSFKQMISRFAEVSSISIDYAILEKTAKARVLPLDITWSDVGSWDSVYDTLEKDESHNVKIGNVVAIDTKNCLIMGGTRLISTLGIEDIIVIETEDALFLGKKGESQKVKSLVEELKKRKMKESSEHVTSHRPWGSYTVLEEGPRYKIKKIIVYPLQRLSLQLHYHRSEHWVVVKGTAKVTLDDTEQLVHENESVFVPKSTKHRLENPGKVPLEIIEVQVGEYVGEDDIVRVEDDYARV